VMCSTKRRQEVIERIVVCQGYSRQLNADFVLVSAKQIVMPDRDITQVSPPDPRWVLVFVLRARRRHSNQRRSELRCRRRERQSSRRSSSDTTPKKSRLKFLVRGHRGAISDHLHRRLTIKRGGGGAVVSRI